MTFLSLQAAPPAAGRAAMNALVSAAKARWAERSTRIAVITLGLSAVVGFGWLTVEQVSTYADKLMGLVALAGLFANVVVPDNNRAVDAAAAADAAVDAAVKMATEAAEKAAGPGARGISIAVSNVADKLGL